MSKHAIEKVLWEFAAFPERVAGFKEDPNVHLASYNLTEDEREMLREMDVREMAERNVSPLLTMMAWIQMEGQEAMPGYMERLHAPKKA